MTEEELATIEKQVRNPYALHCDCSEYTCPCHDKVPVLVTEIRRLRAWLDAVGSLPDVEADERGWMVRKALTENELP